MILVSDITQLINEFKRKGIYNQHHLLIGIDGFLGAGKTYLANQLGKVLGLNDIKVIDLDDNKKKYFSRNQGSIINCDFKKLKEDITNFRKKTSVIFSSVCLLQILKKIDVFPNVHVYIKKMAKPVGGASDTWRDEDDCMFMDDIGEWEKHEISRTLKFDSQINTVDGSVKCFV
ncbi:MAG: hypothetical protein ABH896_01360 [Candidatus Jacksonbacteria bacterium]